MTKIFVITAKDEFELVKRLNNSEIDFFASQPIQKKDGNWVCFLYYYDKQPQNNKSAVRTPENKNNSKSQLATKKQIDYLHGLGVGTPKGLTKLEASKLIEENKGKI